MHELFVCELLRSGWDQAKHAVNMLKEQQHQLTQLPSGTHDADVKKQDKQPSVGSGVFVCIKSVKSSMQSVIWSTPDRSRYFREAPKAGQTSSVIAPCRCWLPISSATTPPTMVQLTAALLGNAGVPDPSTPTGKQQCTPLQLQC